jgi:hypothetical protein
MNESTEQSSRQQERTQVQIAIKNFVQINKTIEKSKMRMSRK